MAFGLPDDLEYPAGTPYIKHFFEVLSFEQLLKNSLHSFQNRLTVFSPVSFLPLLTLSYYSSCDKQVGSFPLGSYPSFFCVRRQ